MSIEASSALGVADDDGSSSSFIEVSWISKDNKDKFNLLHDRQQDVRVSIPGRDIKIRITPTNFSEYSSLPSSSIYIIPLEKLVPHECPDSNLVITPVNIDEVGWKGPAISGFFLDKQGNILVPPPNQPISWLENDEVKAVVLDGANRMCTMKSLAERLQQPGRLPIVPFQAWNYFSLFMGKFEVSNFKATHQDVIKAAITGELIPPKGSRHGIVLNEQAGIATVSPVALCQPVLEISKSDLF